MKSIYNIPSNNHENHITISYRIYKFENHHQTDTQGKNLDVSGPQRTANDVLSRYHHAPELHGQTWKCHLISHHICVCIIQSSRDKSAQAHSPKPLCVLRRASKACISIYVCISYQYLCNHHTARISPQKAKAPKHTAQSLYVCSDGPQRPLISSMSYVSQYLQLCNHHTECICPQKAKAPKHPVQTLYVYSDEP